MSTITIEVPDAAFTMPRLTTSGQHVLVLNASYEPLHRVSLKHAIKMIVREVAVVQEAHTLSTGEAAMIGRFAIPKVLRLVRYVAMKWKYRNELVCTKKGVLARDGHDCGYCGKHATTVDHIVPSSRGGLLSWENSVAACFKCNNKKANRTPAEAHMVLLVTPGVPDLSGTY